MTGSEVLLGKISTDKGYEKVIYSFDENCIACFHLYISDWLN